MMMGMMKYRSTNLQSHRVTELQRYQGTEMAIMNDIHMIVTSKFIRYTRHETRLVKFQKGERGGGEVKQVGGGQVRHNSQPNGILMF